MVILATQSIIFFRKIAKDKIRDKKAAKRSQSRGIHPWYRSKLSIEQCSRPATLSLCSGRLRTRFPVGLWQPLINIGYEKKTLQSSTNHHLSVISTYFPKFYGENHMTWLQSSTKRGRTQRLRKKWWRFPSKFRGISIDPTSKIRENSIWSKKYLVYLWGNKSRIRVSPSLNPEPPSPSLHFKISSKNPT